MSGHPRQGLGDRFRRRSFQGLLILLLAAVIAGTGWAVAWQRESRRIGGELHRYTEEEALTLSRLLLYDLSADARLSELLEFEALVKRLPDAARRDWILARDELVEAVAQQPGTPDALLWENLKGRWPDIVVGDIAAARCRLYQETIEVLLRSLEEDLWARITFSDHLKGVLLRSESSSVEVRAGDVPDEMTAIPEEGVVQLGAQGPLVVHLPLFSRSRRWGEVWCHLNAASLREIENRMGRSLWVSQWAWGVMMSAMLVLWGWLGWRFLRSLRRDVVDPVVSLAARMEGWESSGPLEARPRNETKWLGEAFERLLGRVRSLLRDREEALERIQKQQDQIIRAERLGLLERMGSGLSHELNNALNPARLRLEEVRLSGRTLEEDDLDALWDHLSSAQAILKDLGNATRGRESASKRLDREEWLDVALRIVDPHFRGGPGLQVELPDEFPAVCGDAQGLIQALVNVLLNAHDAAFARGDGLGEVSIEAEMEQDSLRILISDNGGGIPKNLRDSVFEPFVTDKRHGSGLGLFLASSLVQRMGGQVLLRKTGPDGTTFELTVGLADKGGESNHG